MVTYNNKNINKMKKIKLTQGKYALVDDEDFDELNKHKWFARYDKCMEGYYALCHLKDEKRTMVYMHRIIMNAPKGVEVDHINHDTLDNRKENLRLCTHSQNLMNQIQHKLFSSKYKGVSWHKGNKRWISRIMINKKQINLGCFDNEEESAKAYDKKAKEAFGEYALLNDI